MPHPVGLLWFVIVFSRLLWSALVCFALPWLALVCSHLLLFALVCSRLFWFAFVCALVCSALLCSGFVWFPVVSVGLLCFAFVRPGLLCFALVCLGFVWLHLVCCGLLWFVVCFCIVLLAFLCSQQHYNQGAELLFPCIQRLCAQLLNDWKKGVTKQLPQQAVTYQLEPAAGETDVVTHTPPKPELKVAVWADSSSAGSLASLPMEFRTKWLHDVVRAPAWKEAVQKWAADMEPGLERPAPGAAVPPAAALELPAPGAAAVAAGVAALSGPGKYEVQADHEIRHTTPNVKIIIGKREGTDKQGLFLKLAPESKEGVTLKKTAPALYYGGGDWIRPPRAKKVLEDDKD